MTHVSEYTIDFNEFGEYSIDEWLSMLASNRISWNLRRTIHLKISFLKIKELVPLVGIFAVSQQLMNPIRRIYCEDCKND